MKDFDQERTQVKRDLTFKAGGETFEIVPFVPPEHLDAFQPTNRAPGQSVLDKYDEWVLSMLTEESKPRWEKMRKEADPPMSLHDIEQVVFYLVEVATGRPTGRPSRSPSGQGSPAAGSAGTSPSQGVNPA